jgi:hypothetical protein
MLGCRQGGVLVLGSMLEQFLLDVEALRSGSAGAPVRPMLLRWKRSWSDRPLVTQLMARPEDSALRLSLYPERAAAAERPIWWFHVDPSARIDDVEQGSACTVTGHLAPGRALLVTVGDVAMLSTSPVRNPLRGPKLGARLLQEP